MKLRFTIFILALAAVAGLGAQPRTELTLDGTWEFHRGAPATDADGKYIVSATAPDHYEMQEIPHDIGGTVLPTIGITFEF